MPVDKDMLADLFYRQLQRVDRETAGGGEGVEGLRQLLQLFVLELTQRERFHFSTLFARIAFIAQRYSLQPELVFFLHRFRRQAEGSPPVDEVSELYALGSRVLSEAVRQVSGVPPPANWSVKVPADWPQTYQSEPVQAFRRKVRVLALADDSENRQLLVREEDRPELDVRVAYGIPERNAQFDDTIAFLRRVVGFPASLNLLDVEVGEDGVFRPKAFVLEPDYLVDVSSIAECYHPVGPVPMAYLLKKYLPFKVSMPLLLGHVANYLLDELLADAEKPFQELFPQVFQFFPLNFCLFSDQEILRLRDDAYGHYLNLARVIKREFAEEGIDAASSQLEPTFYAEKYGLQGRLDLFHQAGERRVIVELKSGKTHRPNTYGLAQNHYIQTLLYDLLIRSAAEESGEKANPASYILYSRKEQENLRYAPRTYAQQLDALQVRNALIALESWLCRLGNGDRDLLQQGDRLFQRLHPSRYSWAKGFFRDELYLFTDVLSALSGLERKYFYAFSGFIAREQRLAKIGTQGADRNKGQSALWLDSYRDKEDAFEILRKLEVAENQSGEEEPLIVFRRTPHTNPLANFRRGDIAVLYPADPEGPRAPLMHQVFKGTIIELGSERITFRLRSRQFHRETFDQHRFWNLEPDLLDSSFRGQYRGLFAWASATATQRQLWLGTRPPRQPASEAVPGYDGLTHEQQAILHRMIWMEEYFLLWGPPGTGKTSVMLRSLVDWLFRHTGERLLLLAYTNRAVDEICGALDSLADEPGLDYLRIGSRFSTHPRYRSHLLKEKLGAVRRRSEVRQLLGRYRIVVGTVASLTNKPELFELMAFDRMVIDEASQILEPNLLGLLPRVPRVILIGDHQQLPAVVVQPTRDSTVADADLRQIGLTDLRNALFERLYRRCMDQGWTWAYGQLRAQGRMHRDIMLFPSNTFYGGMLEILPEGLPGRERQLLGIGPGEKKGTDLELLSRRVMFIDTPADEDGDGPKTNRHEARLVVRLIDYFLAEFERRGEAFRSDSLGVITPYRAQIAQIRKALATEGREDLDLTVDTVERFQGGARDVIILSLCTNSFNQLSSLISLSDEGVDRKLNVALTRARDYLVVLGNAELLKHNAVYRGFIERYRVEERELARMDLAPYS